MPSPTPFGEHPPNRCPWRAELSEIGMCVLELQLARGGTTGFRTAALGANKLKHLLLVAVLKVSEL